MFEVKPGILARIKVANDKQAAIDSALRQIGLSAPGTDPEPKKPQDKKAWDLGAAATSAWNHVPSVADINPFPTVDQPPDIAAFSQAHQAAQATELRSHALDDIKNVAMLSLGAGAAGRGTVGLVQMLRANRAKKTRSGPANLPLPYPADAKTAADGEDTSWLSRLGRFAGGDLASSKGGIPYYQPAVVMGGLGALGLGWTGMDALINNRRQSAMQADLTAAKQQFHDALLGQYDEPVQPMPGKEKTKVAADATMATVGRELDALFAALSAAGEKRAAIDWNNLAGQVGGSYLLYGGLSGGLAGTIAYQQTQKRSREAILEKALQRRQRRKFMQQPTEIYATPEPMVGPDAAAA